MKDRAETSRTAGSDAPSSAMSFTCSSHDCVLLLGDAVQFPVKRTAAPVERLSLTLALYLVPPCRRDLKVYLWACSGVSIACRGSRLEPSPIEANARVFCFLIERMKP